MLLLIKALVPKLTKISGSTRTDGVEVSRHEAVRYVREENAPPAEPPITAAPAQPAQLELFADTELPPAAAAAVPEMPPVQDTLVGAGEESSDGSFAALLAEIAALPPAQDPEVAAIEDRLDLADAMAEDPHSDRTKRLLHMMAVKELDRIADHTPQVRTLIAAAALSSALAEEDIGERLRAIFAVDERPEPRVES